MFKKVVKETVTGNVIKQIRAMIQSGEFQPGKKIPSERELTEAFSVSRIAVREAIKSLEAKGLLEVRSGEGTFVKTMTSNDLVDTFTNALVVKHAFKDLLEVRRIVEVEIVGLTAERATDEDLFKMKDAIDLMEQDIKDETSHIQSDFMFHDAIAKSSDNKLLAHMMFTVRDLMQESIHLTTKVEGTDKRAYEGHLQIYNMIAKRDTENAKKAMLEHLKMVEEDLYKAQDIVLNQANNEPDQKIENSSGIESSVLDES